MDIINKKLLLVSLIYMLIISSVIEILSHAQLSYQKPDVALLVIGFVVAILNLFNVLFYKKLKKSEFIYLLLIINAISVGFSYAAIYVHFEMLNDPLYYIYATLINITFLSLMMVLKLKGIRYIFRFIFGFLFIGLLVLISFLKSNGLFLLYAIIIVLFNFADNNIESEKDFIKETTTASFVIALVAFIIALIIISQSGDGLDFFSGTTPGGDRYPYKQRKLNV